MQLNYLRERYSIIMKYTGIVTIGIGFSLLLPLLILPIYVNELYQSIYFIIPSIAATILGYMMKNLNKSKKQTTLTLPEGGIIVVLCWIIAILFSAIPFILSNQLNFTQAIFEVVSGWTTTGLSVVDVTKTSNLFLFWRSIMQFFGGAGIAVVMLSSIIGPHGLSLYNAEGRSDKLLPHVVKSTKLIMSIYCGYIVAGIILYVLAGMPVFDAINHAIAALSTGGFSTKAGSIGEYNSLAIELITIILMLLGTINFAAHFVLLKGDIKRFFKIGETKFMFFLMSITIPVVSFLSLIKLFGSVSRSIRIGAFEIISAISTTGFSTVPYTNWDNFAIFIMILVMIIGGGAGSTAGGLKLYRVYLLIKSLIWDIKKYVSPKNSIKENFINRPDGRYYVTKDHILEVSNFTVIYLIIYVLGVIILIYHGYPLKDSMFEFASSLSTVGLSIGITSPDAPGMVLWSQIIGMMFGRLEFFVLFFAGIKLFRDIKFACKHKLKN